MSGISLGLSISLNCVRRLRTNVVLNAWGAGSTVLCDSSGCFPG
jgi:hypothetical protein